MSKGRQWGAKGVRAGGKGSVGPASRAGKSAAAGGRQMAAARGSAGGAGKVEAAPGEGKAAVSGGGNLGGSGGPGSAPAVGGGIGSIRELGERCGVSHTAAGKWVRDPRWPFGAGPWPEGVVEKVQEWRVKTLAEDPAASAGTAKISAAELDGLGAEKKVNILLKNEKAKTERVRRGILEKAYHRVDECEARRVRQVMAVRDELLNLAAGLPFDADVRAVVHGRLVEVCRKFAEGK